MQQLLDKWERLRKSEYLRPDEKLMLNHCISDLKRFMDHSGEVNEMVGKRTAVEWLEIEVKKFNTVITKEYILLLCQQAKEMEKKQMIFDYSIGWHDGQDIILNQIKHLEIGGDAAGEKHYNETYGGNK
jgi:hypothetical protein